MSTPLLPMFARMGVFNCHVCDTKLTEENYHYCMGSHAFTCSDECSMKLLSKTFGPQGEDDGQTGKDLP
jgi:hypothetical protein